jgi:CRP/FNR family cyclic AMP-dependent transcriptional regulator
MGRSKPAQAFDAAALLRQHPVFGALAGGQVEKLASLATLRSTPRGTVIFAKDDRGTALFAVRAGVVKITAPSADGREVMISLVYPGDLFGEIALLDGGLRTADAVAMTDCELMAVDRRDFLAFVHSEPRVAFKLIELLCARIRWANEHFEEVVFLNLPARLARTLLRLADRKDAPAKSSKVAVTQRELGQMVGMARESTNKQLRAWVRQNWIRLERGGIVVLAPDALAMIAGIDGARDTG